MIVNPDVDICTS